MIGTRLLVVTVLVTGLYAQEQDPVSSPGFQHFYNLEYDQAIAEFQKEIRANPGNPNLHNHLAQSLLYREMYRNGALESELVSGNNSFLRRPKMNPSKEVDDQFRNEVETAIRIGEERLQKNPKDIGALYSLGISYALRSNYTFLVKKAWRDSLRDATTARKMHNKISELEPGNVDVRLAQGLHDYIVGSLPWGYRMLGFVIGFHGDREQGIRTIEYVAKHGTYNKVDAEFCLCALYRRENRPKDAIPLIEDLLRRFPRNHLLWFEESQMYSQLGNKEKSLAAVEKVAELKRDNAAGYAGLPWERIWYREAIVQFWYRDLEKSLENFKKIVNSGHELDLNEGVLSWMRMGQIYDMTNRRQQAVECYRKAIAFAPEAEAAKECRRYLSSPYKR